MNTVCKINQCTGCSLCVDICPQHVITLERGIAAYNAVKGKECISCGLCEKKCPQNFPIEFKEQIQWYQGWALTDKIRDRAASGGVASELARTIILNGGIVASCTFTNGDFYFQLIESEEDLKKIAGSKYVKSNPIGIYQVIKEKLRKRVVLFIGLPCQVAALKSYLGNTDIRNLITIDLICHGTPSIEYLRMYLDANNINLYDLDDIKFRVNDAYSIKAEGYTNAHAGIRDLYMMSFLDSVSYTENCYDCQYATLNRVADITLGDSWGTDLSEEEWKKGISLILCQTQKGKDLVENSNLYLVDVDVKKAISNNHQLRTPSVPKGNRDKYMSIIKDKRNIKVAYIKTFPIQYFKHIIKILYSHWGGYDPFSIFYRRK